MDRKITQQCYEINTIMKCIFFAVQGLITQLVIHVGSTILSSLGPFRFYGGASERRSRSSYSYIVSIHLGLLKH